MAKPLSIDDIFALFKATDERLERLREENERRWQQERAKEERRRAEERAEEEKRRAEEEKRRSEERAEEERRRAEERAKEEIRRAEERAEAERKFQEQRAETERVLREERAKTEESFREMNRSLGRISNRLGDFAEEMVAPAARHLFLDRGIPVHLVARNVEGRRNGHAMEIDILVVNGEHALAIEVKSRPKIADIDEQLERLSLFKEVFPAFADRKLMGAIAGLVMDENVARYAYRQGLFVIGQSGKAVSILNDAAFQPRIW